MSSLTSREKNRFEELLGMSSGYVSNFSDRTFGEFVEEIVSRDIHNERYQANGSSKANKLRTFWKIESDDLVADLMDALIEFEIEATPSVEERLLTRCREVVVRLRAGGTRLASLKDAGDILDAPHLAKAVERIEKSIESDPAFAIGTAKELVETVCKELLDRSGQQVPNGLNMPKLIRATLESLELTPDGVPDEKKGAEAIKKTLGSLATVVGSVAELRNLYGTGHGKHGLNADLQPRHARLVVGAASTIATFLIETYQSATS